MIERLYDLVAAFCGEVAPGVRPWEAWHMPIEVLAALCDARGRLLKRVNAGTLGSDGGDEWRVQPDGTRTRSVRSMDELTRLLK